MSCHVMSCHVMSCHVMSNAIPTGERPHLFIIDDAHLMDSMSWRCVVALGRGPTTLSLIAFRTLRKEMPAFQGYLSVQADEWVQRFVLARLARDDMIKLGKHRNMKTVHHTTQYLGLECPAVALSLTSILSSKGMVS